MLFRIGAAPFGGGLTYPIAVFKKVTARSQNHGRSLEGGPFDEIGSVRSRFMCLSSLTSCLFLAHADTGERDPIYSGFVNGRSPRRPWHGSVR